MPANQLNIQSWELRRECFASANIVMVVVVHLYHVKIHCIRAVSDHNSDSLVSGHTPVTAICLWDLA